MNNTYKFELGDSVVCIDQVKREGTITSQYSYSSPNGDPNVSYMVTFYINSYSHEYGISEYLGKKRVDIQIMEKDLEPIPKTDVPEIQTAYGQILDQVGVILDVTRNSNETDESLRQRMYDKRNWYKTSDTSISICAHVWKHYQGLLNSFDFCEKCDIKKKEV